jgi:4-amino-4-deoxy-L-arabinose transferase-like glycosyltransferase
LSRRRKKQIKEGDHGPQEATAADRASDSIAAPITATGQTRTRILLLLIILIAAFFRLYRLGDVSLRADTINFWTVCHSPMSAVDVVRNWKTMGLDHPPFTLVLIKFLYQVTGAPVTHFTIHLVPALFGIATVPILFLCGRRFGGNGLGLFCAALAATSPFHIQISREAYHYALMILGASLMFLALLQAAAIVFHGDRTRRAFYWTLGLGFFGVTQSTFTGWSVALVEGLAVVALLAWKGRTDSALRRPLWIAIAIMGVLFAVLAVCPWGVAYFLDKLSPEQKTHAGKALLASEDTVFTTLTRALGLFSWGSTPVRVGFLIAAGLGALAMAFRRSHRRPLFLISVAVMLAIYLIYALTREAISALFEGRYLSGMSPVYLVFLAAGIWSWCTGIADRFRVGAAGQRSMTAAAVAVAVGLNLGPAWTATALTGNPLPYRAVVSWLDSQLPKGTLVLVDRWFEPWNELAVYNSTNVFFAFTVPDEPVDVFLSNRWRDTAVAFFEQFPDAAYFERAKHYWSHSSVGRWEWPRQHFRQRAVIINEPGLKLRRMGLAARGDFYEAQTNCLYNEIFYNTRDDVVEIARQAGRNHLLLYGPEWGYTKLWRQTGDFRDWRIMQDEATLDLYNLTSTAATAKVTIGGFGAGSAKNVRLGSEGTTFVFPPGRLAEWVVGPVELKPGLNQIALTDPFRQGAQVPLLVDRISVDMEADPQVVGKPAVPQEQP